MASYKKFSAATGPQLKIPTLHPALYAYSLL